MSHPEQQNDRTAIEGNVEVKNGDFVGRDKIFQIGSLKISKSILWLIITVLVLVAIAAVMVTIFIPGIYQGIVGTSTPIHTPKSFSSAAQDETLVLIADIFIESCIDDPACRDPNNVTQKFINSMRDSLSDHPNIRVERLQQYIYEEGGSELAMEIGQRPEYNAAFVMWGNYVLKPEAEIYIFFDIMESTLPIFGNSYDESYGPSSIQPSMFEFKADLGTHWGQMTAFAAALALYQNRDYKNAIPLFDTAAQGIDSSLFQSMKRVLHFYRGSNYLFLNNGLAAKTDLEALEAEEQLNIADDLTISLLNRLGFLYSALGDKEEALYYYNQALPLFQEASDKSGQAATLNNIGSVYGALGDKKQALEYYNQALPLSIEVGDKSSQATTLNNIGTVYDALGDKEEALEYYNQALPVRIEVGDKPGQAVTLNNIGLVYSILGDKERALEYYNQALPLSIEVGDKSGQARTLNNIGFVYSTLDDKGLALEYYNQALPLFQEIGDKSGQAMTLSNIGLVYDGLDDKLAALEYYNQALSLSIVVGDKSSQAKTLNNIGAAYDDLGYKQQSLDYYSQALSFRIEVGDIWGESTTRYNIGFVHFSLGEYHKAEEQQLIVVQIDEEVEHPDLERDRAFLEQIQRKIAEQELE